MQEILTVSALTEQIKGHLEGRFTSITVRGEISNFKEQSSGHFYFTLKDTQSQISAVLFKGNARMLSRPPKSGEEVVAKGELNVYPPKGNYQLIIRELSFTGVGELLLKLHELKLKLEQLGWFDRIHKKPLPKFPKTIGVVTSPTGSVIQDILQILNRRFPGFHLILNPVRVQGEGAAQEIATAIEEFNRFQMADLLIVGRGGGSLEDLWAFNEERVAQAIFASKIPIISAVGHETDVSIADFVADVRAPTPSAAAEMAIGEKMATLHSLNLVQRRLQQTLFSHLREQKRRLEIVARHPLLASPYALLGLQMQRVDDMREELDRAMSKKLEDRKFYLRSVSKQFLLLSPKHRIGQLKERLKQVEKSIHHCLSPQIAFRRSQLARLLEHLKAIDPKHLLQKGYCILFQEKKDCAILSSHTLAKDQKLRILMHDGQVITTINEIFS